MSWISLLLFGPNVSSTDDGVFFAAVRGNDLLHRAGVAAMGFTRLAHAFMFDHRGQVLIDLGSVSVLPRYQSSSGGVPLNGADVGKMCGSYIALRRIVIDASEEYHHPLNGPPGSLTLLSATRANTMCRAR